MEQLIDFSIISVLEGSEGSNPHIAQCWPEKNSYNTQELLKLSLPIGALPQHFYENILGGKPFLIFTFGVKNTNNTGTNLRDHLVSFGFRFSSDVNLDEFKKLIKKFIAGLEKAQILTLNILQKNLSSIFMGFNSISVIQIPYELQGRKEEFRFDIQQNLGGNSIYNKKTERKVKGGLL